MKIFLHKWSFPSHNSSNESDSSPFNIFLYFHFCYNYLQKQYKSSSLMALLLALHSYAFVVDNIFQNNYFYESIECSNILDHGTLKAITSYLPRWVCAIFNIFNIFNSLNIFNIWLTFYDGSPFYSNLNNSSLDYWSNTEYYWYWYSTLPLNYYYYSPWHYFSPHKKLLNTLQLIKNLYCYDF